jgi:hypothetical protein
VLVPASISTAVRDISVCVVLRVNQGAEPIRGRYFGTNALSSKKNLDDTHEEFFRRENRE